MLPVAGRGVPAPVERVGGEAEADEHARRPRRGARRPGAIRSGRGAARRRTHRCRSPRRARARVPASVSGPSGAATAWPGARRCGRYTIAKPAPRASTPAPSTPAAAPPRRTARTTAVANSPQRREPATRRTGVEPQHVVERRAAGGRRSRTPPDRVNASLTVNDHGNSSASATTPASTAAPRPRSARDAGPGVRERPGDERPARRRRRAARRAGNTRSRSRSARSRPSKRDAGRIGRDAEPVPPGTPSARLVRDRSGSGRRAPETSRTRNGASAKNDERTEPAGGDRVARRSGWRRTRSRSRARARASAPLRAGEAVRTDRADGERTDDRDGPRQPDGAEQDRAQAARQHQQRWPGRRGAETGVAPRGTEARRAWRGRPVHCGELPDRGHAVGEEIARTDAEHDEERRGTSAPPGGAARRQRDSAQSADDVADRLHALVGVVVRQERPEARARADLELGELAVADRPLRLRAPAGRAQPAEVQRGSTTTRRTRRAPGGAGGVTEKTSASKNDSDERERDAPTTASGTSSSSARRGRACARRRGRGGGRLPRWSAASTCAPRASGTTTIRAPASRARQHRSRSSEPGNVSGSNPPSSAKRSARTSIAALET